MCVLCAVRLASCYNGMHCVIACVCVLCLSRHVFPKFYTACLPLPPSLSLSSQVTALLAAGADPDLRDAHSRTPLLRACERGNAAGAFAMLAAADPTLSVRTFAPPPRCFVDCCVGFTLLWMWWWWWWMWWWVATQDSFKRTALRTPRAACCCRCLVLLHRLVRCRLGMPNRDQPCRAGVAVQRPRQRQRHNHWRRHPFALAVRGACPFVCRYCCLGVASLAPVSLCFQVPSTQPRQHAVAVAAAGRWRRPHRRQRHGANAARVAGARTPL